MPQESAELGLLVTYAMDMYTSEPASLAPASDTRLYPKWKIWGYLTATDCVFRSGSRVSGSEVCYGFLAESDPGVFVAVIRGTNGILEWIEDGEFLSVQHPVAGQVEAGFFGVYSSMVFRPLIGAGPLAPQPVAKGIAAAIGAGSVTVIGHSLGSALATFLTFDLAGLVGSRTSGCFFASPRPGNADFAKAFDARVASYQVFNYALDIVPRVPPGDYSALPKVTLIEPHTSEARISFNFGCFHHVLSYCAMLDFGLTDWKAVPSIDQSCAACIRGPSSLKNTVHS